MYVFLRILYRWSYMFFECYLFIFDLVDKVIYDFIIWGLVGFKWEKIWEFRY